MKCEIPVPFKKLRWFQSRVALDESELRKTVEQGGQHIGMPAWNETLSTSDIQVLSEYVGYFFWLPNSLLSKQPQLLAAELVLPTGWHTGLG